MSGAGPPRRDRDRATLLPGSSTRKSSRSAFDVSGVEPRSAVSKQSGVGRDPTCLTVALPASWSLRRYRGREQPPHTESARQDVTDTPATLGGRGGTVGRVRRWRLQTGGTLGGKRTVAGPAGAFAAVRFGAAGSQVTTETDAVRT
jgi:hypothetical protein